MEVLEGQVPAYKPGTPVRNTTGARVMPPSYDADDTPEESTDKPPSETPAAE